MINVSQSTVSRAFYPDSSMRQELRNKVLDAARKIGFSPNAMARALVSQRSRIIGLFVSYLDNMFYPFVLEKLSKEFQQLGYQVMLFMGSEMEDPKLFMTKVLPYKLDGIVMASTTLTSRLGEILKENGIPVVMFNRYSPNDFASLVISDNVEGGRMIGDCLARGGHKRIAFLAGLETSSTNTEREEGFRQGLAAHGIEVFRREVGGYKYDLAQEAARKMFTGRKSSMPDAVFVANDHMAFAVMDVLRYEKNLSIPEDVSVAGYDNVPMASWPSYSLTSVEQRYEEMADIVVRTLCSQIEQDKMIKQKIIVHGDLILRGSTRKP